MKQADQAIIWYTISRHLISDDVIHKHADVIKHRRKIFYHENSRYYSKTVSDYTATTKISFWSTEPLFDKLKTSLLKIATVSWKRHGLVFSNFTFQEIFPQEHLRKEREKDRDADVVGGADLP